MLSILSKFDANLMAILSQNAVIFCHTVPPCEVPHSHSLLNILEQEAILKNVGSLQKPDKNSKAFDTKKWIRLPTCKYAYLLLGGLVS